MEKAKVVSINISPGGIPKTPVPEVFIREQGLEGDGHNHEKHYRLSQAVSLQSLEVLEELRREGYNVAPGTTGENLTLSGINVNTLPLETVLRFPSGLTLVLTRVRKACYVLDAIDPTLKDHVEGRLGMYARVEREGLARVNDDVLIERPEASS